MNQKKAAWRGGIEHHISSSDYTRRNNAPHQAWSYLIERIEAGLKTSIVWFPTHGLMPIVMADRLIRFFRLEAS